LPFRTKFPWKAVNILEHHGCLELQSANLSLRVSHTDIDFDGMWIRLGVEKPTQCGVRCLIPTLTCHPLRTVALHRASLSGCLLAFARYKLAGTCNWSMPFSYHNSHCSLNCLFCFMSFLCAPCKILLSLAPSTHLWYFQVHLHVSLRLMFLVTCRKRRKTQTSSSGISVSALFLRYCRCPKETVDSLYA
jgi:hypothetical protein